MKKQAHRQPVWVLLSVISLACYLYLASIDPAEITTVNAAEKIEKQEGNKVSLPDIALLKKVYELAQAVLRRQG